MGLRDRVSAVYNFIGDVLGIAKNEDLSLKGSEESVASFGGISKNPYDLELVEHPVRNPGLARQLMDLEANSYTVQHTLWHASRDTFASSDGDEQGFKICDTLKDNKTPVDPDIKAIATELINRTTFEHHVIGGERMKRGLENGLCHGDAFIELGIEATGVKKGDYCIADSMYLPTWEMFQVSDPQGRVLAYEQRKSISDKNPEHTFYPWKILHMCYHPYRKYGRSLWKGNEALTAWKNLKEATKALARGAIELGYNPTVHQSASFSNTKVREAYADNHEQRKAQGIVTDLYIATNSQISKLANFNPDLEPLIRNVLHHRYIMIPAGYPTYYYPGLSQATSGAKEISNQPALNYSRIRHDNCAFVAKSVKQAIAIELTLKLGIERYYELMASGGYRLEFPAWRITPHEEQAAEEREAEDNEPDNNQSQSNNKRGLKVVV